MKIYKFCFALLLLTLLMAGCSGGVKDANNSNFKAAAQAFLDREYPYYYFTVNFPYQSDQRSFNNTSDVLHVLAKLGMVTETEVSRKEVSSLTSEPKVKIIYSYELTDEGQKFYKAGVTKDLRGNDLGGFVFGKATALKILNFTEPADYFGHRISDVTYTYTVSGIPEWAKDAELLELDNRLKIEAASANTPIATTDVFVLTEKGWIHEQLWKW